MYRMGSTTGVNLVDGSNISRDASVDELRHHQHQMNYGKDSTSSYLGQENSINGGDTRMFLSSDILNRRHQYRDHHTNNNNSHTILNDELSASHSGVIPAGSNMMQTKFLPTIQTSVSSSGNNNHNNNSYNNNNLGSELESLNETTINDQEFSTLPPPPLPLSSSSLKHQQHQQQNHRHHKGGRNNVEQQEPTTRRISDQYLLWIITPVAASISLAVVVAALAGPQWLYTEEKLPNSNYNGTANFNAQDDGAFITKYTKSSLWILCSTLQGIDTYHCIKIDYFPKEEYRPDHHDSTLAIPYTVTRSSPFFLVSGVFLLISFFAFLIAICTHQNSLYYFTSGILFIVSGLLMFIGLIVYISIFKAEIGSKLRPKSTLQPPLFKYYYGQSFFLYVFGFISTEFVGVLNIFLFISFQQVGYHKTIPCFAFLSAPEKVKDVIDKRRDNNRKHVYPNGKGINGFMCRKHSIPSNYFFEHEYYFEKPQKCGIHSSQNLAKSLNELYLEPSASNFSSFDIPQEFPLTRSISTSTEIFSKTRFNKNSTSSTVNNQQKQQQLQKQQSSLTSEKKNKKNQTNVSKESLNDICGLSRGILAKGKKSKDDLFNEFCKRAGMRPKPKDIYYIEDNDEQDDENIFIVDNNDALIKSRRNSFREPRKRNSISSLRLRDKIYPKSLFDVERHFGGSQELWNYDTNQYFTKNELRNDSTLYQSRTLPRCFLKRNFDSVELMGANRRGEDNDGGGALDDRYYDLRRQGIMLNGSREYLRKSFDDINFMRTSTNNNNSLQYRKTSNNNLSIQWPTAIPTSPSSYSVKSAFLYNGNNGSCDYKTIPKFTRGYAFDDRRSDIFESFDLDEIERERRKSHASLLGIGNNTLTNTNTTTTNGNSRLNGTAV